MNAGYCRVGRKTHVLFPTNRHAYMYHRYHNVNGLYSNNNKKKKYSLVYLIPRVKKGSLYWGET
jgi:hypothetical protein